MPRLLKSVLLTLVLLVPAVATAQGPPRRVPYESTCGSEMGWLVNFEEALKAAKKQKKPIFWYVPTSYRTFMDRRQELHWNMMAGPFSDPAVVAYLKERYIPLMLGFRGLIRRNAMIEVGPKDLAEKYELVNGTFIEPGFVLLDKNGKLVHTTDRLLLFQRDWFLKRMDRIAQRNKKALKVAPLEALTAEQKKDPVIAARLALGRGEVEKVLKMTDLVADKDPGKAESAWLQGVAFHMQNQTSKGMAAWKSLIKVFPGTTWAAKAQAELDGWGPFLYGFESYRDFPDRVMAHKNLRHSRAGGIHTDESEMVGRALRRLLDLQREDGSWSDSRYDFGGLDSLPNVHVAVTAIAARALLEWRDAGPVDLIDRALEKAIPYLMDDGNLNPKDKDEIIWAYSYRIHFFSRLVETSQDKSKYMPFLQKLVTATEEQQQKSGAYRHEYAAAFTSSSVLHALYEASRVGADVALPRLKAATKAVLGARVQKSGAYGYGLRGRGSIEASAGRMPLCELALYLGGASSAKKLQAAVATSFKRHADFEKARNYDDHMRSLWGIGGFFFWYDMHGRAEAINRLSGRKANEWKEQMRQIVYSTHEADGGWIDSHEVGKSYGTAMALTVLKLMKDLKQ